MLARVLTSIAVGVVVYLVAFLVLGLLSLATYPWSPLLGLLAGLVYFLNGSDQRFFK